jgi:hypothetical protein
VHDSEERFPLSIFYPRQDQDRGILRTGRHEGDWEMVQLRLDARGRPREVVYLRAGVRDRMWPDPNDEADGRARAIRPRTLGVSAGSPGWMRWPGHWGGARARWWMPGEQSSPQGPAFQPERWSDPDGWAESARSCQAHRDRVDECDGGETALGAVGVAAFAGGGALAWRRRRLRA